MVDKTINHRSLEVKQLIQLAATLGIVATVCFSTTPADASGTPAPAAGATAGAGAAARPPVRNLLWVGNSFFYYNNSMHAMSASC